MSEEQSLKSEKKSESEASVPGEKTGEREREGERGRYCHCIISGQPPRHTSVTGANIWHSCSITLTLAER